MSAGDDVYQRQPLLSQQEEIGGWHESSSPNNNNQETHFSPRVRNGSAVKIEMPPVERIEQRFPKERWKTLVALVFVFFNFLATTASLSITHELRLAEAGPLPDITLDNIPYQTWALDVSEILIMVATITASLIVVFHKHRLILIRRVCLIVGLLYGYRAITMIVTVLPSANPEYRCDPKLNHTITTLEVARRVVKIISGFGLTINGQHVYCGDFIFSGHTMILILCYLIISEYTPRCLFPIHWLAWLTAVTGVVMLMLARGHYSIDVILAYFITTRLWFMYNSIILNPSFQTRSTTNHLGRLWWWRLAVWFEENVKGPVPVQYEWPLPWPRLCQPIKHRTRTKSLSRDI
jgi:shingomyelin synthase